MISKSWAKVAAREHLYFQARDRVRATIAYQAMEHAVSDGIQPVWDRAWGQSGQHVSNQGWGQVREDLDAL